MTSERLPANGNGKPSCDSNHISFNSCLSPCERRIYRTPEDVNLTEFQCVDEEHALLEFHCADDVPDLPEVHWADDAP